MTLPGLKDPPHVGRSNIIVPSIYEEVHGLGYNMRNGYGVCRGDEMLAMFIFGEEPPPVDYGPLTSTGK